MNPGILILEDDTTRHFFLDSRAKTTRWRVWQREETDEFCDLNIIVGEILHAHGLLREFASARSTSIERVSDPRP